MESARGEQELRSDYSMHLCSFTLWLVNRIIYFHGSLGEGQAKFKNVACLRDEVLVRDGIGEAHQRASRVLLRGAQLQKSGAVGPRRHALALICGARHVSSATKMCSRTEASGPCEESPAERETSEASLACASPSCRSSSSSGAIP
eukprot:4017676-Pleurochrysis_carterae.AAC.2